MKVRGGTKRVFWVFGKDGDEVGVLRKREAIVAIEMGIKSSLLFPQLGWQSGFCYNIGGRGKEWRVLREKKDLGWSGVNL